MISLPLGLLFSPITVVVLSVLFLVVAIGVAKLHPFLALMSAAILVGLLSAAGDPAPLHFSKAVEKAMVELGSTAGKIAFTIALASVIGFSLMESGAADKIVRRMIAVFGEKRAALALLLCGFILAAPVFIDTVFLLLLPLARALGLRTGKDYLLYVLAIGSGAVISNGVVPPAPGPLVVAETLKIEVGHAILGGVMFGILPALGGLFIARWFNRRHSIPVRTPQGGAAAPAERTESELPGLFVSAAPVVLPMLLIALAACVGLIKRGVPPMLAEAIQFFGNKNIALAIGAVIALATNLRQKKLSWRQTGKMVGGPLETAGMIILIVSAGGAFGAMIKNTGVGEQVRALAGDFSLNHVLLAWLITAFIRGAVGSATVATITGVGIMASIAGPAGYGVHPLYILLAIGFGSKCLPWMNDAGFWVVSRVTGLTQGEMLRTWSPALSALSVLGLIEVLIASAIWPQLPF